MRDEVASLVSSLVLAKPWADGPAVGGRFSLLSGTVRDQADVLTRPPRSTRAPQIQRMVIAKRLLG
jgi:hypothetical protein